MIIKIKVKTSSKKSSIEKSSIIEYDYKVNVASQAKNGKANSDVKKIIAQYFNTPKSSVSIILGEKGKIKLIKIDD